MTDERLRTAFRDLHESRLFGFTLLLTLGDRSEAARLTAEAIAAADARLDELRHPERAAAWLRRHVVRHARRFRRVAGGSGLEVIGATRGVGSALARLQLAERAALIAEAIERLDARDVATVVGRDGRALDRLLRRARQRYVHGYVALALAPPTEPGPIATRIRDVAMAAIS